MLIKTALWFYRMMVCVAVMMSLLAGASFVGWFPLNGTYQWSEIKEVLLLIGFVQISAIFLCLIFYDAAEDTAKYSAPQITQNLIRTVVWFVVSLVMLGIYYLLSPNNLLTTVLSIVPMIVYIVGIFVGQVATLIAFLVGIVILSGRVISFVGNAVLESRLMKLAERRDEAQYERLKSEANVKEPQTT